MEKYTEEPVSHQAALQVAAVFKSVNLMSVGVAALLSTGMIVDKHSVTVSVLSGVGFYGAIAGLLILWQPGALPFVLVNRQHEITERRRDEMQYRIHLRQAPQVSLADPLPMVSAPPAQLPTGTRFVPAIAPADQSVEREAVAWVLQLYGRDGEPDPAKVLTKTDNEKPGRVRIAGPSKAAKQWLVDRRILHSLGNGYRLNLTRCPNIDAAKQYLSTPAGGGVPYPPTLATTTPQTSGGEGGAL
jgi:hypothetical protein